MTSPLLDGEVERVLHSHFITDCIYIGIGLCIVALGFFFHAKAESQPLPVIDQSKLFKKNK